jgi:hypothetical protein
MITGYGAVGAVHAQVAVADHGNRLLNPGRLEISGISEFKRLGS